MYGKTVKVVTFLPCEFFHHITRRKKVFWGRLGGSVGWASNFSSGHDLTALEFEPHVRLWADGSEPGAWLDSVSPSLSAPPLLTLSFFLLQKLNIKKRRRRRRYSAGLPVSVCLWGGCLRISIMYYYVLCFSLGQVPPRAQQWRLGRYLT